MMNLVEDRADYKYMQPVIAGRAERERLGESAAVCVFVMDAASAAGATRGQTRPRLASQPVSFTAGQPVCRTAS